MVTTTDCRILYAPETPELRFLPEGPYSLPDGRISWVSIQHGASSTVGAINILDPDTGQNQSFELPGRPGFAFPTNQVGVFICGVERSLGLFDTNSGVWKEIRSGVDDHVENTIINDGVVYEDNLIFGCKDLEFKSSKAGLYLWRGSDQRLLSLRGDQICSNGKAILSDKDNGLCLIDIDSPSKTITRAPLDIAAGAMGDQQIIVDLTSEDMFPDGMILTPDGQSLIVAFYHPGDPDFGVARQYGLSSSALEAEWRCPGSPRVTCPQLVRIGQEVKLVLTTAVEHMEPTQQQRYPHAGALFVGATTFDSTGDQPVFPIA